jgi:hypothetical protein
MVIQYISDETSSGVVDQPAGPGTTPSYGNRAFALGWIRDVAVLPSSADYIVEFGGRDCNTSRNMSIVVPPSGWLWCSSSGSSPSVIDQRMCAHGMLVGRFRTTSTTAAATYGRIDISYDLSFRYPMDQSLVGVPRRRFSDDDEKNYFSIPK